MCLTYIQDIFLKTLLSAMLAVSKIKFKVMPFAVALSDNHYSNENTQSTRMHVMIPLAKNLPCIKIKSEASLAVYSHLACSIVVLDDMGMTATLKEKNTHTQSALPVPTCHIDMISMLNIAKICW